MRPASTSVGAFLCAMELRRWAWDLPARWDDRLKTKRLMVNVMSTSKVQCKCCGKMMVPRVIFGRGMLIGYGMRIGGGAPESSCCPFCLSEEWDGVKKPGTIFKVAAIIASIFTFMFVLYVAMKALRFTEIHYGVDLVLLYPVGIFASVALGIFMEHWFRVTSHRRVAIGVVSVCLILPCIVIVTS